MACPIGDKRWAQWRDYFPYGGGMITDFGAHMFDIVQWALNMDNSGPVNFEPQKYILKVLNSLIKMESLLPIKMGRFE